MIASRLRTTRIFTQLIQSHKMINVTDVYESENHTYCLHSSNEYIFDDITIKQFSSERLSCTFVSAQKT
jgi:hypothetical protein